LFFNEYKTASQILQGGYFWGAVSGYPLYLYFLPELRSGKK